MEESSAPNIELLNLQRELVLMQQSIQENRDRLLIIFEGRDAAGKGGAIRRFTRHLNPRGYRVIALPKPTEAERGQWFFQRYFLGLPNAGEIIFFDRSWYNRAVVEPVMGFCTQEQYEVFIKQAPKIERMLVDDGVKIIKFWFSIQRQVQGKRFDARRSDILKQWKLSTVDALAQERWDDFTKYKELMFERTHTSHSPWIIVNGNHKETARIESMRFLLSKIDYRGKGSTGVSLAPDPQIVTPYHPAMMDVKKATDQET